MNPALIEELAKAASFRKQHRRPFVLVTYAQSVDGSIAARNRTPIRLSGKDAMLLTHRLRSVFDGILVGIGTVLSDNPRLTARSGQGKNPQPIILDTRLRTPPDAYLVQRSDLSSWLVSGTAAATEHREAIQKAGAQVLACDTTADGKIDLHDLMAVLAERKVNSIMVEGGAQVITSFFNARLVDLLVITIAPKLVGGLNAIDERGIGRPPFLSLRVMDVQHLNGDIVIWAKPDWSPQ